VGVKGGRASLVEVTGDEAPSLGHLAWSTPRDLAMRIGRVPRGVYAIAFRRVDESEPYLFGSTTGVALPDVTTVTIPLRSRLRSGLLEISVVGSAPTPRTADVQVFHGVSQVGRATLRSREPSERVSGLAKVPADIDLEVRVAHYTPASAALGPLAPQTVNVAEGSSRHLEFRLPAAARVTLRTEDENGEYLPFTASVWDVTDPTSRRFVATGTEGEYDSELRFARIWLRPGLYFGAANPRARGGPAQAHFAVGELDREVKFRSAPAGPRTTVEIRNADGKPFGDESINLNRVATELEDQMPFGTRTDDRGRVVTPPIPSGRYRLMLWSLHLSTEVELRGGDLRVTIPSDLGRGGARVEGVVRLRDGGALSCATYLADSSAWTRFTHADHRGRFAFDDASDGTSRVFVAGSWFSDPAFDDGSSEVRLDESGRASVVVEVPRRR
jgi:hypothetical protein